jgi:hypothetical protein
MSVRIAGSTAEIRIQHLLNTSQDSYRYTNLPDPVLYFSVCVILRCRHQLEYVRVESTGGMADHSGRAV